MDLKNNLKTCIEAAIENSKVIISDPREDGKHLEAIVVADIFENMPLIERHQMVMNSIKNYFKQDLHALSLKTLTQNQFDEANNG